MFAFQTEHREPLIGERKVCRVIALHQIPDEQVLGGGMGHPGLHPIRVGGKTEKQHPFRHGEFGRDCFRGGCFGHDKSFSTLARPWTAWPARSVRFSGVLATPGLGLATVLWAGLQLGFAAVQLGHFLGQLSGAEFLYCLGSAGT
jgi:hypothetical protein